ncbi:MAG: hypothetical protein IMY72_09885 [Bacteroidetes bacterium]|nr:hypothetical protein [Bacteroidota bacterium]
MHTHISAPTVCHAELVSASPPISDCLSQASSLVMVYKQSTHNISAHTFCHAELVSASGSISDCSFFRQIPKQVRHDC